MHAYIHTYIQTYTHQVDIAHEFGYSGAYPYSIKGYRSDCRNYAFNEVMYVAHRGVASFDHDDRVFFKALTRRLDHVYMCVCRLRSLVCRVRVYLYMYTHAACL